jgi:hypothetical protein
VTLSRLCFENCVKRGNIVLEAGSRLSPESVSSLRLKWNVTCVRPMDNE